MGNNFELSEEEKRILQKHKDLEKEGEKNEKIFWKDQYPNFSVDDKIKYWLANIHHGMRIQGEGTSDPYSEFSKEWYEDVKKKESDFDSIFEKVVPKLGFEFDWQEYYKRIS